MKNVTLAFLISFCSLLYAGEVADSWSGTFDFGGIKFRLVLHIAGTDSRLGLTMNGPALQACGIPAIGINPGLQEISTQPPDCECVCSLELDGLQIAGNRRPRLRASDLLQDTIKKKRRHETAAASLRSKNYIHFTPFLHNTFFGPLHLVILKTLKNMMLRWRYFVVLFIFTSCGGNAGKLPGGQGSMGSDPSLKKYGIKADFSSQVSEYIRRIVQDKNGNLWFGTESDGVCRYDGKSLVYFTQEDGLGGTTVRGIVEDKKGDLWFATNGGVSRYDGKTFRNFTTKEGLSNNETWSITEDKDGKIWAGTIGGVCRFDGDTFTAFAIPTAKIEKASSAFSTDLVWSILEDKKGNLWFGTDGAGICKYSTGSSPHGRPGFASFTEQEGLAGNHVTCIIEDKKGDLWFGSRTGGVSRYDGKSFINFKAKDGLGSNSVWSAYEDKAGNLWFTTTGLDRYDGKTFTHFNEKDGLANTAVQSILEDRDGRLWVGTGAGLFRFDERSERFINVGRDGPWE